MVNNKKLKEPQLISFQIENEQLKEFNKKVSYLGVSKSQFLRQLIETSINNNHCSINELIQIRNEKINERNNLNQEIEQLNKEINLLTKQQNENEQNNNILMELIEKIKDVSINENGITLKRIEFINNGKIRQSLLIQECKKQGIKIIKNENEKTNSIIKDKPEPYKKEPIKIVFNLFSRQYKGQKIYNEPFKFLSKNETKFKTICQKKGVSFNDFKHLINKEFNEQ